MSNFMLFCAIVSCNLYSVMLHFPKVHAILRHLICASPTKFSVISALSIICRENVNFILVKVAADCAREMTVLLK